MNEIDTDLLDTEEIDDAWLKDHPTPQDEETVTDNIEFYFEKILHLLGEDVDREGLRETPARITRAWREMTRGLKEDPRVHLKKTFTNSGNDMIIVKDIPFNSICEHHFVPFIGRAHIGYIPGPISGAEPEVGPYKIVGLSKFPRLIQGYAARPQVQEQLTDQIASAIDEVLEPLGVIVVLKATHMCMSLRGIKATGSSTVTSSVRGVFDTNADGVKEEFFNALKVD